MIYDYLYLLLKEKIKDVAEIKAIEMDYGQDEDNQENQLITTPAVLIGFPEETEMYDLANGLQEGQMLVSFRLVTVNYRIKDDRVRKIGKVNHYDVARLLFKKLNKLSCGSMSEIPEFAALDDTEDDHDIISSMRRSGVSMSNDHSVYIKSEQTFDLRVLDPSGNKSFQSAVASLEINNLEILP